MRVLLLKAASTTGDLFTAHVPGYTKHDGTAVRPHERRIVRVLGVKDTRQYEEGEDDKFHPIPGSGIKNQCHRCGKDHEVHATVELDDGTQACVGTGCMVKDNADLAARVKSMDAAAKRLARLKAEQTGHQAKVAKWETAKVQADAMTAPPVEHLDGWLHMGDARVKLQDWSEAPERQATLERGWRENRLADILGVERYRAARPSARVDLAKKIAALEKEMAKQADGETMAKAEGSGEKKRPLYVNRRVKNAADIIAWAKLQGFKSTLPAEDIHVTQVYSKAPMDWAEAGDSFDRIRASGDKRKVAKLGDKGAVVLHFDNPDLRRRWQQIRDAGASWDYESYNPHLTISYDAGDLDLSKVEPYRGPIELGPERYEPLDEDWGDKVVETPVMAKAPAGAPKLIKGFEMERRVGDFGQGPAVLFFKSYVKPTTYTRNGKTVQRKGYTDKRTKKMDGPRGDDNLTGDLFADQAPPKKPMGPSPYSDAAMREPEKHTIPLFAEKQSPKKPEPLPNPKEVERDDLAGMGKVDITDVGGENIYFKKDVRDYYSKVYDTDKYKVGSHDFAPAPKAPTNLGAKVTPQVLSNRQAEQIIKIAADSIKSLRKSDVERVLSETPRHYKISMGIYIKGNRPDLAGEVDDVLAESAEAVPKASRKYYVTMRRDGKANAAWLAGPYDTHEQALAQVDTARKHAEDLDPRAVFDSFGTASYEADEGKHHAGILNDRMGLPAAGSATYSMPKKEAIAEHERLVGVLNSPSHADDKAEAKKQAKELAEMKEGDDHPAPVPRRTIAGLSDADRAEWLQHHRLQHELEYYEMPQLRGRMDKARHKKNLAESEMRQQEAHDKELRGSGMPGSVERADLHRDAANKLFKERKEHADELGRLSDLHQKLYESAAKHGRAKHKLIPESGDLRVDFMAMKRRDDKEEAKYAADAMKQYRTYFKGKKPMAKAILFLKTHVETYTRNDGSIVAAHEYVRPPSSRTEPLGAFKHKETKSTFHWWDTQDKWAKEHGFPHEIEVGPNKEHVRFAHVKGTVAHVAVDEDEHGNAVTEKWPIRDMWRHHALKKGAD